MSVRWERFAGDTASFAVRLSFHHDPDISAAALPEMAESWGAFQIWVRGVNLCAHVDGGETLQFSHWYLLPILEWLSANWDPLLHEERPPLARRSIGTAAEAGWMASIAAFDPAGSTFEFVSRQQQYGWNQRHALRTARDGGITPDVRFRRVRDQVEISWTATQLAGAGEVEFLSNEGTAYEAPSAVAEPLYEILASAAEWLHKQLPQSERCQALVDSVAALRSPRRTEERTAWIACLGTTWDRIDARWREFRDLGKSLGSPKAFEAAFGSQRSNDVVVEGSCGAALLFGSASPTITGGDAKELARLLLDAYEPSPVDGLADLAFDEPINPVLQPWRHGYLLAEDLLDQIRDECVESRVDVEALLDGWGVRLSEVDLEDPDLRAVAFVGSEHAPSIALNSNHRSAGSAQARRFTLAHELCHLLHDRTQGARLAMASGPWAPKAIEQRANAFAAWLLMPPESLNSAITSAGSPIDSPESVSVVAGRLDVSRATLVEHLYNLGYIHEEARDELRPRVGE